MRKKYRSHLDLNQNTKKYLMIYPISYSFPAESIVPYISFKTEHTAKHLYQFEKSEDYLKNYRNSFFGMTQKRAGWDCLRHYEILSQGTIPHFTNLENLPLKTMVNFPKELVIHLNKKYYHKSLEEIYKEPSSIVYNDLDGLLQYTKEHLTTEETANYLLEKSKHESAKEILLLTNLLPTESDYLLSLTTHGFKQLFKGKIDCYPEFDYHYTSFPVEETKKMYGRGFNYTRFLPDHYKSIRTKSEIEKKVQRHEYDCIFLFFDEYSDENVPIDILKWYKHNEIAVICGKDCNPMPDKVPGGWITQDTHTCNLTAIGDLQTLFIRELGY